MNQETVREKLQAVVEHEDSYLREVAKGWTRQSAELVGLQMAYWVSRKTYFEMLQQVCSVCGEEKCDDEVVKITRAQYLWEKMEETR